MSVWSHFDAMEEHVIRSHCASEIETDDFYYGNGDDVSFRSQYSKYSTTVEQGWDGMRAFLTNGRWDSLPITDVAQMIPAGGQILSSATGIGFLTSDQVAECALYLKDLDINSYVKSIDMERLNEMDLYRIEKFEHDGLPWVVSLLEEYLSPFYQRAARESLAVINCLG